MTLRSLSLLQNVTDGAPSRAIVTGNVRGNSSLRVKREEPYMTQGVTTTTREETITSADGLDLFVRSWRPTGKVRGVVAIVPGFNAHSGYYAWPGERFVASGLAAYAVDDYSASAHHAWHG